MKKRGYIIVAILSIIAASILLYTRISVEQEDRTVDFILDYYEIEKLAEDSKEDLDWWLKEFKKAGASSVAINYVTLGELVREERGLSTMTISQLKSYVDWKGNYSEEALNFLEENNVDKYDLLVSVDKNANLEFVKENLLDKYPKEVKILEDIETDYILIDGTRKEALFSEAEYAVDAKKEKTKLNEEITGSKLSELPIGMDQEKLNRIEQAGLKVVPRMSNGLDGMNGMQYIEKIIADYDKTENKAPYIIFNGKEILGNEKNIEMIGNYIIDNDLSLGLIEADVQRGSIKQEGMDTLLKQLDYQALKVFSIPPYIQERYEFYNYEGSEEIENTLYRGITERNIKAIYFKPFKTEEKEYVTDVKEYRRMFSSLEKRINKHGIEYGEAEPFRSIHVSKKFAVLVGLAAIAGGIFILDRIIQLKRRTSIILMILGSIGVLGLYFVLGSTAPMLMSIVIGMVFPTIAVIYYLQQSKKYYNQDKHDFKGILIDGIKTLIIISGISLIGGLFIAAIMSDIKNLLDIDYFRGVKITQFVPIGIYIILFIGYFGYKTDKELDNNRIQAKEVREILNDNVKIIYALIAIVVAAFGYIYMARTGHETEVQPTDLEMIFRNLLENNLLARPRNKEFLAAFPAVLLGIYMAKHKYKIGIFVMGLAVIIGQTSIVNTFTHFKTPVYMSAVRTVYGLILGIIIGIVYTIILNFIMRKTKKLRGELLDE